MKHKPRVVVIGGGTGSFVVLSGLKKHDLDLTAIITVADSGGSTGRLRDEFGFLPVGDLRQSLAALAQESNQSWIKNLLLYRFSHGKGLKGHNLGNLILTSLQDMMGSTPKALETASKIFRLEGNIYPVTTKNVDLVIEYHDGTFLIGEHRLNPKNVGGKKIKKIRLSPQAAIYHKAKKSIEAADIIITGPGDLYASILPNFVVTGAKKALKKSKAKIIYIVNLMTRYTQTHNFSATDHVEEIAKYLGRYPDYIVVNSGKIPLKVIKNYKKDNEFLVKNDLRSKKYQIISAPLASVSKTKQLKSDSVRRSLLRHKDKKLTQILLTLIKGK